jgi:hypothetical protein
MLNTGAVRRQTAIHQPADSVRITPDVFAVGFNAGEWLLDLGSQSSGLLLELTIHICVDSTCYGCNMVAGLLLIARQGRCRDRGRSSGSALTEERLDWLMMGSPGPGDLGAKPSG